MDEQKELIISSLKEFLDSAREDERKDRIRSAATMYFKAITEICDYLIYNQILKVPENHNKRFEILERFFPNIHARLNDLFKIYRKTYSQKIELSDLEQIKNETIKLIKETKIIEIV